MNGREYVSSLVQFNKKKVRGDDDIIIIISTYIYKVKTQF